MIKTIGDVKRKRLNAIETPMWEYLRTNNQLRIITVECLDKNAEIIANYNRNLITSTKSRC